MFRDEYERLWQAKVQQAFDEVKAEHALTGHLYCGHCGSIKGVEEVDFHPAKRHLCVSCRIEILEWI